MQNAYGLVVCCRVMVVPVGISSNCLVGVPISARKSANSGEVAETSFSLSLKTPLYAVLTLTLLESDSGGQGTMGDPEDV